MLDLLHCIERNITVHGLLHRAQRVLVAVSGGVDSMVLLKLLRQLSRKHHWKLFVAHLNHQLRGRSSIADERLVRRFAKQLKLPVSIEQANVRQLARQNHLSLEMAARAARHHFLAETAGRLRVDTVALAHHADDQVELFFLRLLRGSGGEGLAGMKWHNISPANRRIRLIRPLLDVPKSLLRDYAQSNRIPFREDASNQCWDILRNRIRGQLLPLLRQRYQPALDNTILRTMEIVRAEADLAADRARKWLQSVHGLTSPLPHEGAVPRHTARRLEAADANISDVVPGFQVQKFKNQKSTSPSIEFRDLPIAVQRQCLRLQLLDFGFVSGYDLVERLRLEPGKTVRASEAVLVYSDHGGILRLEPPKSEILRFQADSLPITLGTCAGNGEFSGVQFSWRVVKRPTGGKAFASRATRRNQETFDADWIGSGVLLRHWRPGDRFQPIGMKSASKLQDLFTNAKLPREFRHRLIVAEAANGELFWVEGLRIGERFKLTGRTRRQLAWRWERVGSERG